MHVAIARQAHPHPKGVVSGEPISTKYTLVLTSRSFPLAEAVLEHTEVSSGPSQRNDQFVYW